MILIFYVFSPVFICLDRHPKSYLILPFLLILTVRIARPSDYDILRSLAHFLSVYIFGMLISRYKESILPAMKNIWLILLLFSVWLTILEIHHHILLNKLGFNYSLNTLTKILLSILLMYFLWRLDSRPNYKFNNTLKVFADWSFAIYFLHGYIMKSYFTIVEYCFGSESLNIASALNHS
jgi:peptidoglycan/LPS O-acetylase OafA/YrhL